MNIESLRDYTKHGDGCYVLLGGATFNKNGLDGLRAQLGSSKHDLVWIGGKSYVYTAADLDYAKKLIDNYPARPKWRVGDVLTTEEFGTNAKLSKFLEYIFDSHAVVVGERWVANGWVVYADANPFYYSQWTVVRESKWKPGDVLQGVHSFSRYTLRTFDRFATFGNGEYWFCNETKTGHERLAAEYFAYANYALYEPPKLRFQAGQVLHDTHTNTYWKLDKFADSFGSTATRGKGEDWHATNIHNGTKIKSRFFYDYSKVVPATQQLSDAKPGDVIESRLGSLYELVAFKNQRGVEELAECWEFRHLKGTSPATAIVESEVKAGWFDFRKGGGKLHRAPHSGHKAGDTIRPYWSNADYHLLEFVEPMLTPYNRGERWKVVKGNAAPDVVWFELDHDFLDKKVTAPPPAPKPKRVEAANEPKPAKSIWRVGDVLQSKYAATLCKLVEFVEAGAGGETWLCKLPYEDNTSTCWLGYKDYRLLKAAPKSTTATATIKSKAAKRKG